MVDRADWGKLKEVLDKKSSDDLSELCYILSLPYSGPKYLKIRRILKSEFNSEYVKRRADFLDFGLHLVDQFSAGELADIVRDYDLPSQRTKKDKMVEIVRSEMTTPRSLLGQLSTNKLRRVHYNIFKKKSAQSREELIRTIGDHFELEWLDEIMDSGFIMMAMKKDEDLERTYQVIKDECRKFDIRAERIDETATSGVINDEVLEKIRESKHLFVDLTHERPNVYYELGYTHGLGKSLDRIVLMARKGTRLHFDIRNMRTIFYANHEELREGLQKRLKAVKKG